MSVFEIITRDCFFHGRETARRAFRVCFECDHIFKTARHLRREHHRVAGQPGFMPWLKSFTLHTKWIQSCPLCTHDW